MHKTIHTSIIVRFVGAILLGIIAWNFIWILDVLNPHTPLLSAVFFIGFCMTCISYIISVLTNWNYKIPTLSYLSNGNEPTVAVLIPTYGEPVEMVLRTIKSVTDQNWPHDKLIVAIGDDAGNEQLEYAVDDFSKTVEATVIYHKPHPKGHHLRLGEAKAGNLNSLLFYIMNNFPEVHYVETRDADDLVGTKDFLRYCLGQHAAQPDLSFVQTIKECQISRGDPFSNMEDVFYKQVMFSRHGSNAVFPCGSGLVWKLSELRRIGGFPYWNLVEDLQSGFEILLLGGKGCYLPIIGAVGQIAPEDIPNFYKQRGTWALDTLRLFFWKNPLFKKQLSFGQKLHFIELEYSYILSFAVLIFVTVIAINLFFNISPLQTSQVSYLLHTVSYALAVELFNYVRIRGISYRYLWRSRRIWIGLSPVFMISTVKALFFGPNKKPAYKVTRKNHQYSWYWQETIFQYTIILILFSGIIFRIFFNEMNLLKGIDSIVWAVFFIYGFSQVVKNSWFRKFSITNAGLIKKISLPSNVNVNIHQNSR